MYSNWLWKRVISRKNADKERVEITFGEQAPHFSVTADTYYRNGRGPHSCGRQHDLVAELLPALAPFIKWHLSTRGEGPMHYVANAVHWLEHHYGCSRWSFDIRDRTPLDVFKSHVVFGAVEGDDETWATTDVRIRASFMVRNHECGECFRTWTQGVALSDSTPNLSGEATVRCPGPECKGKPAFSSPAYEGTVEHKRQVIERITTAWCESRLPALLAAYEADMEKAKVIT